MRAAVCVRFGTPDDVILADVDEPQPAVGEIVVDVHSAGVNFFDLLMVENKYQLKLVPPFSPGGEIAGVVSAVGDGVRGFAEGDRVAATIAYGGFAERVAVPASAAFHIPRTLPMDQAATFPISYGTAYHALRDRGAIVKGERLLVLGAAGGVGLAAVQLGRVLGAVVIAAASSSEKLDICSRNGAEILINYGEGDFRSKLRSATDAAGVDVVFDPVGGALSELAFRELAWKGRMLTVGYAAGEIPRLPLNLPLLKGASLIGGVLG